MTIDPVAISISIPAIVLLALVCYAEDKADAVKYAKFVERRALEAGSSVHDLIYAPPLMDREMQFVYREHSISEHRSQFPKFFGWTSVAFGASMTCYHLTRSDISLAVSTLCMMIMLPCGALFISQTAKSCQCGFIKVLSRRERYWFSRFYDSPSNRSLPSALRSITVVSAICIGIIGILLGSGALLAELFHQFFPAGKAYSAAAMAVPTALLAVLVFAASVVKPKKRFMPVAEVERLLSFTGQTAGELEELIEFYSRIGNFERADQYSRMLIVQAEQTKVEGKKADV
ncbi:MAG: hypothetical protein C0507_04050 [Cyanobacteria bacterium PR.3.49]|nr:hypothetical protein [Cyanobacteria bacterium PR.3.49]